ncbi:hypothetical protein A1O3_07751 [Capronia epimyces CBS 606.96]|uniref:Phosphatidylinositol glycan, class S n=1 Tax=Capronia epimyces CBS 606.96 TaxID=1182542 RepID=W9YGQ6_9EURO|nr:uncharacterized protein A1O3_07751 [Capronia epimyces CBS 606.96]EXJ81459.1 hypothetical protein A1O3_07751 [Capronia epimyces CBS 606.96]
MEKLSAEPPTVVSASTSKQPPPEKPEAVSLRTKIVLSFWAVILFLGLPTWWQTTSIYRADLPLQDMLNWADGFNTPTAIPLHIWISSPHISCSDAERIVRDTQQALDDLNEYPTLHQRLHLVNSRPSGQADKKEKGPLRTSCGEDTSSPSLGDPALKVHLEPANEGFAFELDPVIAEAVVRVPRNAATNTSQQLAEHLYGLFREEQIAAALQTVSLASHSQHAQAFLRSQPYDRVTKIEKQVNRAYKSSPEFHLTFSLFTASGAPSSWDVQDALKEHISPLVQALSSTSKFDVTTQIQLYSSYSPAIKPIIKDGLEGTFLQQKDLTAFVNAAEWPLAPSIGYGPTINFILYVPAKDEIPLRIDGVEGTSWLIPQWGGIQILNPPLSPDAIHGVVSLPPHLTKDLLRQPFEAFASQLLSVLGVPQADQFGKVLPLQLRLDVYKRFSTFTLYLKAASSLGSLARLAQRLSNIPIPKHVAELVDDAIGNLTAARHAFLESRWDSALTHSEIAYSDSEKAFFDKSMVGQVYFPDEHKVAVYLPLLGPIGVPLLVGLLRELKRFATRMRGLRK